MGLATTILGAALGGGGDVLNFLQWQELQKRIDAGQTDVINEVNTNNKQMSDAIAQQGRYTRGQSASNYSKRMANWNQDTGNIVGEYDNLKNDTIKGYKDRYARGMDYLKGQGSSERARISRNFASGRATSSAGFGARGLAGTGIVAANDAASRGEESLAIGDSQDRTNRLSLSTDAALSGDELTAEERLGKLRADTIAGRLFGREGLYDESLQSDQDIQERYGQQGIAQTGANSGRLTNAIQSHQFMAPVQNPLQSVGAGITQVGMADTYAKSQRQPWWKSAIPGAISAGGSIAGAGVGAYGQVQSAALLAGSV